MAEYGIKQTFPDKIIDSSTTQKNGLGVIRFDGAKEYRYVQIVDKGVTKGDSVCPASTAEGIVTADRAGGSQLAFQVRGVAIGAIGTNCYGWIQVKGNCEIQCDGGVAAADGLVPHATADGHAETVLAASNVEGTEYQTFGFALNTDSTSADGATATAYINCP